jgi:hypothetical protein
VVSFFAANNNHEGINIPPGVLRQMLHMLTQGSQGRAMTV